jgi:LuxR family transcriptional regulator, maltose regulon positive regulatory protein
VRVSDGWTELEHARWPAARAAFEADLAGDATPEAYEGLSWAAWWQDDGDAVFAARERAFTLYRERGEVSGAARMALWLGVDELDFRGSWAVAGGWFQRAERLLEGLEPGPEHGWLAFHRGYVAHASGDTEKAGELAVRASELGRRCGVPDLEMLGLALEGATLVACARVEEGMQRLDEATATALEGGAANPMSGAWTFCFLVSACTSVLDYGRAAQWCDRIAEFAERYGSRMMLAYCRAEYGAIDLWRGRWTDAEAMLEAAIEDFTQTRPGMVGGPLAGLAELRRRQGRPDDAARLCEQAEGSPSGQLCLARMALDRGAAQEAAELAERLLRKVPEHRRLSRAPALELLVRARAASGDLDGAATALVALREVDHLVGTPPLGACADVAEGVLAAARGDHDRARVLLEDAVDCFAHSGAPFEAAQARLALAATLEALGRADAAAREAAAARERLRELAGEPADEPLPELTPREREVLALLAEGLTNRGIAERLVVSEHTVHRHVNSILRKLDLPSRTAAAAVAVRSGL